MMPLSPGNSSSTVSKNIREMQASGHPHNVAVAAALSNADRHPRGAFGGAFKKGGSTHPDINVDALVNPTVDQIAPMMQRFLPVGSAYPVPQPKAKPPVPNSPDQDQQYLRDAIQSGQLPDNIGGSEPDFRRGGKTKKFAAGGIPTSEALDPWYTRAEYRGMVQPEGLIKSTGAGRTDVHNINVPSGSYIVPADVTSGLGEGNTLSGADVMDRMMHSNPFGIEGGGGRHGSGPPRPPRASVSESRGGKTGDHQDGMVPIIVAGGEMLYHPHTIIQKFGSLKKGHATLDAFVKRVRKDTAKTMLKLPGPKK